MLYFSKLRIFLVLIVTVTISYFSLSNFVKFDDELFKRSINLGLDLQGGSYLLLEVDNKPVVTQKLQSKVIELKKFFKKENILIRNISIDNDKIIFEVNNNDIKKSEKLLDNDESEINPYFPKYKTHQFNIVILDSFFYYV